MVKEKIGIADSALRQARSAEGRAAQQERAVNGEVAVVQKKSRGFWAKLFSTKAGRAKKAADLRRDVLTAKMASMQARAAAMRAAAMKHEAASSLSFFNLTSPINGMIETRSVEPGDLVDKGQVLLSVIDPRKAYLRAFVAEGELSRLHVGQPAKVYLDSNEKLAPLSGRLIEIDSAPSFTPQNVYFKDDRVRQTFGLKISLDHPEGLAKPGMRGDAKITVAKASGGNQK